MRGNLILLILAVVLAIPTTLTLAGEEVAAMKIDDLPLLLPGWNPDAVNFVTLAKKQPAAPGQQQPPEAQFHRLVFMRSETGWMLGPHPHLQGLPIKKGMVEEHVLDHLGAIRLDREALDTVEADEDYLAARHLTEETATIVVCQRDLQSQEFLAEVFKGSRAEEQSRDPGAVRGYYVCRKDKPKEVVLYDPNQPWEMVLDANEWVEKDIYDILMGDVESFRITNDFGQLAFRKKKGSEATWVKGEAKAMAALGAVRQGEVTRLLEQFRKITADGYEGPINVIEEKLGLDKIGLAPGKSKYEFLATLKDGQEYWLRVGGQVPNSPHHYAVSSQSEFVFTVPGFVVRPLNVEARDLCDPAPAKKTVPPEKVKPPEKAAPKQPEPVKKPVPTKQPPKVGDEAKEEAKDEARQKPTSRKQNGG